jgi:2-polyprenyl-3-methyl-5-hydroxy-6-metoxy-1,4-benzoquinol methylase
MKWADRVVQKQRIRRALHWIEGPARVLDVGCADGALFAAGGSKIASGIGVDLHAYDNRPTGPFDYRTGSLTDVIDASERFTAITMLAVVEHLEEPVLKEWADAVPDLLAPGGRLIITVPSPLVDKILHVGMALRIFDGIEAHEHHGFQPDNVSTIFASDGVALEHHSRFQFGLNNLFVFRRLDVPGGP